MNLGIAIIILPHGKIYLPFDMTNFTSAGFVSKHTNCAWWEAIHETRLDNYRLYI